ncbi:MAG: sulfatase-like hydrolase/transferase [Candidatus Nitrotoga sp.]|nr:sulfatase-like hydrolase/transferase [Candidatus Nitrotoga sp.]
MSQLTVLICTHDRADLLERVLVSLNTAKRPAMPVQILVAANACTDDTLARMQAYQSQQANKGWLPLRAIDVSIPGKSHALNRAIPAIDTELVAFVDDDHRVHVHYLVAIEQATQTWPDAGLYCGRILPDWDGTEPAWVHDEGPYRIYPLPVPRYDGGDHPKLIDLSGPFPGGGNLFLRRDVLEKAGGFSTELGPKGHDLGGGEDSDFVLRVLTAGVKLQYVPDVAQYHYVDLERFKFHYILQKSYQRSRSVSRVRHGGSAVPRYMWRKLANYLGAAVLSLNWPRTRFYLVRLAATLGEIRGMSQKPTAVPHTEADADIGNAGPVATAMGVAAVVASTALPASAIWQGVLSASGIAAFFTLFLLVKSVTDFSRTGPGIREEIKKHYSGYSFLALLRLGSWSFALSGLMAGAGVAVYGCHSVYSGHPFSTPWATASAVLGMVLIACLQFCQHLLYLPATIAVSSHYRLSRFYALWRWLSPAKLRIAQVMLVLLGSITAMACVARMLEQERWLALAGLVIMGTAATVGIRKMAPRREAVPTHFGSDEEVPNRPNIIMIGSDTLRADRLGAAGYYRSLTPHIDALAKRGVQFTSCYVPCARTAPSLLSLLTGTWPHHHGIRDNFVGDDELTLPVQCLPAILAEAGYQTAVVGDWSAGDMSKFNLGFQQLDLPKDQWNIKYLIRQGPKDLRLFLSLFTHNRFGKRFLPELYYLAGIPLTREIGRDARAKITDLSTGNHPFFLNVFMATTHPPFGSEYPYYTLFSNSEYSGESKFVMARLTDPFEIIRRQGDSRKEFDLDQILNLYDGCVKCFDDEVARILAHIEGSGLMQSTIVVIYSDHGMEFFEHETWGQGNSVVGDFSPKVPLVIVDPRRPGGGIVEKTVRSIDVAPTLLDLASVPKPPSMDGKSLEPFLDGKDSVPDLPAFAETGMWLADLPGMPEGHLRYPSLFDLLEVPDTATGTMSIKPEYRARIIEAKDRMIRKGSWKLTYQPLTHGYILQLFDVEADPMCRHNLIEQHPDLADTLWRELSDWIDGAPNT